MIGVVNCSDLEKKKKKQSVSGELVERVAPIVRQRDSAPRNYITRNIGLSWIDRDICIKATYISDKQQFYDGNRRSRTPNDGTHFPDAINSNGSPNRFREQNAIKH